MKVAQRKAQTGVEAFIIFLVITLFIVYAAFIYVGRLSEAGVAERVSRAQTECQRVSESINRVRANGNGFAEVVSFDSMKVTVFGGSRVIEVPMEMPDGSTEPYVCTFSTSNVTNATHETFELSGDYKVMNNGNNVTFQKLLP